MRLTKRRRMRLSFSMNVVESAERVIGTILKTYSQPNLTAEETHAWARERNDPLPEFSNICGRDLQSLWNGLQQNRRRRELLCA
jgi:hypothetical protein